MGWIKKVLGISQGGGGPSQAQQTDQARRAKLTPEQRAAEDIDIAQQKAEAAMKGRPANTLNAGTAGKPMPGTDFSKFNFVQPAEYDALLNASNEKQKRLAAEVTIAQSKPASRRSTKGGTVRNKQSAGGYESPFASLLGG